MTKQILSSEEQILSISEVGAILLKPYHENITLPDANLPVKAFIRTCSTEIIQAHPHWHQMMELLYIYKGSADQQLNHTISRVNEGDVVIIGSGDIHSTYTLPGPLCQILVIQIDRSILDIPLVSDLSVNLVFDSIEYPLPLSFETKSGPEIRDCMIRLYTEFKNKEKGYNLLVRGIVIEIIGLLVRYFSHLIRSKADIKLMSKARELLLHTFTLVETRYSEKITLLDAAIASSFSVPHFCRLFKMATGMTFMEYLSYYRVKKAIPMIDSKNSITKIAMDTGFGSIITFNRTFKRYIRMTPTEYLLANK